LADGAEEQADPCGLGQPTADLIAPAALVGRWLAKSRVPGQSNAMWLEGGP